MQKLYHCTCCEKPETEDRFFSSKSYDECKKKYGDNRVINSKYTILSFLPLILITHLSRFMNLYFIIIGVLQLFKSISPVNPLTTWAPIVVIFAITFIREGIDDYHHHLQDNEINSRQYVVIRDGHSQRVKSKDITVGDIVVVDRDRECPCDMVILHSTDQSGVAYIETSNLDGETNLKEIRAIREFQELGYEGLKRSTIYIKCRPPSADIYTFIGSGYIDSVDSQSYQMDKNQFMQSGVFIKSVDQVYGIACYTGNKTKLGLNSNPPPVKWTQIERFIDKCSIIIFISQIILAIIYGSIANWQKDQLKKSNPYLRLDIKNATQAIILYARCYLLTSVMIPISLKVTLDICKYIYATWIRNDFQMYDEKTHTRVHVNNTSVIEDLGAIEYIFTDKTGTLTQNEMILQKIGINSQFYGYNNCDEIYKDPTFFATMKMCDPSEVEIPTSALSIRGKKATSWRITTNYSTTKLPNPIRNKTQRGKSKGDNANNNNNNNNSNTNSNNTNNSNNNDSNNNNNSNTYDNDNGEKKRKVSEFDLDKNNEEAEEKLRARNNLLLFILNLCLCHSIKINDEDGVKIFEGVSSDEVSFLQGMDRLGIDIKTEYNYNSGFMNISIHSTTLEIDPTTFEILDTFPFSYTRRRMSVIAKEMKTGKMYLFSKGAHESIEKQCSEKYDMFNEQVESFSYLGLRVMAFSYKEIDQAEYDRYRSNFNEINRTAQLEERESRIENLDQSFEGGQILLGCTAIEDKLQENTAQTIEMLRNAGIKIWMVTGDVEGTSLKIARTTKLLDPNSELINITKEGINLSSSELLNTIQGYVDSNMKPYSLLIHGDSPRMDDFLTAYRPQFSKLTSQASCVICCRTTPKRKAQYVELIQQLKKITLAVGDGGNDVFMIRSAHIGVGIMGKEGRQAASASDFGISNFQSLQRLILIHGRFSFYRTSWLTQFCFYKSIMLSLVQVLFMFWNGYSGASLFNDFNLMCYNAIFTLLPVIFFLFDKDVEEETVFIYPFLYSDTRLRVFCNSRTMFWWIMRAIYQAVVVTVVMNYSLGINAINGFDGSVLSLDEFQQIIYSTLILNVLFTVIFDTQQFTSMNFVFIWGNWFLYILFTIFANLIADFSICRKIYLVCWRVYANPFFWITVTTTSTLCIMPIVAIQALFSTVLPTHAQELRYIEVTKQSEDENPFFTSGDGSYTKLKSDMTIWESSHNLCTPLGALCGCSSKKRNNRK